MPGPIITASEAKKRYRSANIKKVGSKLSIRNSSGDRVEVWPNTKVYHRGNGKFGLYTSVADKRRKTTGHTEKDKVGSGRYRHTNDRRGGKGKR